MRRKITIVFLMAAVVCLTLSAAQADYLFDTGTPPGGSASLPFGSSTGYAGYLTVPAGGWHITGLEAYLVNNGPGTLYGIVRIWPYTGPVPVNSQALISPGFNVSADDPGPGWFGRTDLSVDLAPGTYWFGLMNSGGDGGVLYPAPQSFVGEATYYNGTWTAPTAPDFGYRITGTGTPIPLPGAAWLLGSGLLGLLGYRRMKQG